VVYGQPIPRLLERRPDLPAELEPVMQKALALDPEARFRDADAFAMALREVARQHDLLCAGPDLAAELRDLLGPNPDLWSQDDGGVVSAGIDKPQAALEGKEAAAIGIGEGAVPEAVARDHSTAPWTTSDRAPAAAGVVLAAAPSAPAPAPPALSAPPPPPAPVTATPKLRRPSPASSTTLLAVGRRRMLWWVPTLLVLGAAAVVAARMSRGHTVEPAEPAASTGR
jgi:hypothetical protein